MATEKKYKKKANGKNDTGRPKKDIDYKMVEKLASIMATQEEIASFIGMSVKTLQRDDKFCRIYKEGLNKGKMSLRRKQFGLADKNASMGIWLGKQYLDQKDRQELEHSGTINISEKTKLIDKYLEGDKD